MKNDSITSGLVRFALLIAVSFSIPGAAAADAETQYLERAREYRQAGDLKAAVIELKNAARQNPKNAETRLRLGAVYLRLGQGPQAQKEYEQALNLGISAEQVDVPRARAMLMQGKYRELLKEIQPGPELSEPTKAAIHALRGEAQMARQDKLAAAQEFAKALALDPEQVRALLGEARLQALGGDNKQARKTLGRALALAPKSVEGWSLRGDLERAEGRLSAAERAYTKAIEASPLPESIIVKRARVRIGAKDYAGAERDVATLRRRLGDHPAVRYLQGLLDYRQGDFAAARDSFQAVLARQPDNLKAAFFLGIAHYALDEYEQAVHRLGRFVKAYPDTLDAQRILVLAKIKLGDVEGARPLVEKLLTVRPNDVAIMTAWGNALVAAGSVDGQAYLDRAASLRQAGKQFQSALVHLGKGERELAMEGLEKAVELAPRLLTADVLRIREYLRAKEYAKALAAAKALQPKWPGSPHPLTLQGLAYVGLGDAQQARALFLQAWQLAPGNPPAANALATLALQAGDVDGARGYYRQTLEQHPGHLPTLLALAKLEARQGNGEAYRELLEDAALLHPDSLPPRLLLARLYLRSGDPEEALAILEEVKAEHGEHPGWLLYSLQAQSALGLHADALASARQLAESKPNSAAIRYMLAAAYANSGEQERFESTLIEALGMDPEHRSAGLLMRRLVMRAGDAQASRRALAALRKAQPDHPMVTQLEGALALREKHPEEAVEVYRKARERYPDNNVWALRLAQAQTAAGDRAAALATLDDWLSGHPEDAAVIFIRANTYLALGRTEDAKDGFAEVVRLSPDSAIALNNLAWLLRDEDPDKALEYAQRAARVSQAADIMDTLGVILLRQGRGQQALEALTKATEAKSEDPAIRYHYARALVENGRRVEAREVLEALLAGRAAFTERGEAKSLLASLR